MRMDKPRAMMLTMHSLSFLSFKFAKKTNEGGCGDQWEEELFQRFLVVSFIGLQPVSESENFVEFDS